MPSSGLFSLLNTSESAAAAVPSPMAPLAYGKLLPVLLRNHARELAGRALPEPWLERLKALAARSG